MSDQRKKGETPLDTIVEEIAELGIGDHEGKEDAAVDTEHTDQGNESSIPQPPSETKDTANVQAEASSGETSGQEDYNTRGHYIDYPPLPLPFAPSSFSSAFYNNPAQLAPHNQDNPFSGIRRRHSFSVSPSDLSWSGLAVPENNPPEPADTSVDPAQPALHNQNNPFSWFPRRHSFSGSLSDLSGSGLSVPENNPPESINTPPNPQQLPPLWPPGVPADVQLFVARHTLRRQLSSLSRPVPPLPTTARPRRSSTPPVLPGTASGGDGAAVPAATSPISSPNLRPNTAPSVLENSSGRFRPIAPRPISPAPPSSSLLPQNQPGNPPVPQNQAQSGNEPAEPSPWAFNPNLFATPAPVQPNWILPAGPTPQPVGYPSFPFPDRVYPQLYNNRKGHWRRTPDHDPDRRIKSRFYVEAQPRRSARLLQRRRVDFANTTQSRLYQPNDPPNALKRKSSEEEGDPEEDDTKEEDNNDSKRPNKRRKQ